MQRYLLSLLTILFSLVNQIPASAAQGDRAGGTNPPNVIVIITDDQGYGDLGYHGNEIIKTPNLDRFFSESVRADNFHVSPTCAPTRGALMTGRYTNRVGSWHTIGGRSLLFEDETILPQIFAENGYATGMFGKWHLGDNYPFRPEDRGFHEVVRHGGGGVKQGPDYWGNDYFDDTYWHNSTPQKYEGYVTDVFFEESLKFIENNKDRPFFLYLAPNAPHSPYHVPEEYYRLYEHEEGLLEQQKRFYGMITNIDDNFGRLRQQLEDLGIAENTILIFTTDNGTAAGFSQRDGVAYGFNAGMRGTKGSEYDGGHRVPFAVQWPAGLPDNKDIDQLLAHIDVLPTLVDLAGLRFTERKPLDGRSFAPLLQNTMANWPDRTIITDSQRELSLVKWKKSAVMDNTWRLVNGKNLYNILKDPGQEKDVAAAHPDVVGRLRESYNRWWTSLEEQEVSQRYAYIKAGSPYENPVRLSAHDMHIYPIINSWHQHGALLASARHGVMKIEIVRDGRYRVSLRRYPRESGLAFNQAVEAEEETLEINAPMPAAAQVNLNQATLYLADMGESKPISGDDAEITFQGYLYAGKYDMIAYLTDEQGRVYPSYYTYIEKLDD